MSRQSVRYVGGGIAVAVVIAAVVLALVRPWESGRTSSGADQAALGQQTTRITESTQVYDPLTPEVWDDLTGYLYRPDPVDKPKSTPVIVLIHGGGWLKGPDAQYVAPIARSMAEQGYVVWNVNYRRVGEGGGWPTTFTDLAHAVDHLTKMGDVAPEMDLDRVTVVGHSAGGQLAAWTAGRHTLPAGAPGADPKLRPHAVVSLAGVLDMQTSLTKNDHVLRALGGTPDQVPERYSLVDPLERLDPDIPLLAITGTDDNVVPPKEASAYVQKHRERGGRAALVELPALGHGDVVDVKNKWWPTINTMITTVAEHGPSAVVK